MTNGDGSDVRLAVVVPAHRQPQFLAGAVMSALGQDTGPVGVVIVNDGCPFASTERIALELRDAHPGRVRYLRLPNRGVAAARNAGVREALSAWPAVEALFPLDADNRLSPYTLGHLERTLQDAAWAYPALEHFGADALVWETSGAFSAYRQLFENQCDAGSLISRSVFDDGLFFDEALRAGYEDWEFFTRAARAGLRGVPAGRCGFRYRHRGRSMFRTARARHDAVYADLRLRLGSAFDARALTRLEHEDLPRFALVSSDRDEVLLTACADLPPRTVTPAALAASVESGDAPPLTIVGTSALWSVLGDAGLLPGLLLRAQEVVRRRLVTGLRLATGAIEVTEREWSGRPVHAVIAKTEDAVALDSWEPDLELELRLAAAQPPPDLPAAPTLRLAASAPTAGSNTGFSLLRHVDRLETTFPHSGGAGRAVWVVADAERAPSAVALAGALQEDGSVHLALTGGAYTGRGVDTVTLLDGIDPDASRRLLAAALGSADIVLVAGAALGYEALALLEATPLRVALEDEPGTALRDVEDLVDVALATSEHAAYRLENLDVVPDKITVVDLGDPGEAARIAARALEVPA